MGSPGGSFGYPPGKGKGFMHEAAFPRFSFFFTRHDFYTARLGSRGSLFTEEVTSGKSRKTKEKERNENETKESGERGKEGEQQQQQQQFIYIFIIG